MVIVFRLAVGICCLVGLGMFTDQLAQETPRPLPQAPTVVLPQAELPILLARVDVQEELRMTSTQCAEVDEWLRSLLDHLERNCPRVESCDYSETPTEETEAQLLEIRAFVQDSMDESELALPGILTTMQLVRLHQLQFQRKGVVALQATETIELFQLTRRQLERIRQLPVFGLAPSVPDDLQQQCDAAIDRILTPSQQQHRMDLAGERFKFAADKGALELRLLNWFLGIHG